MNERAGKTPSGAPAIAAALRMGYPSKAWRGPGRSLIVLSLFFFSGMAALIYEVLWMKELGLLFGNTVFASATTLSAFFLGLAAGSYFFAGKAREFQNPLRVYGLLEWAVALCVIGYFQILDAYHAWYPAVFEAFGNSQWKFIAVKFGLSLVLLFPAAFFIGGTLPVMTQYWVQGPKWLGRKVSTLYAVNTFGAAFGSLLAGVYLPPRLGFHASYGFAMATTALVGSLAFVLARRSRAGEEAQKKVQPNPEIRGLSLPLRLIQVISLLSGFTTLCLQVLWTRMFAQVLQNSVYTFATLLFVFLLALAAGAVLAKRILHARIEAFRALFFLLVCGGLSAAATPFAFRFWTDGLQYVGAREGWVAYLGQVLALEIQVMALPVLVLGAIFPMLLKMAEPRTQSASDMTGKLLASNHIGSILGSLAGGFVVLELVGTWGGIRLIGVIDLLAALYLAFFLNQDARRFAAIPMLGILVLVSVMDPSRLPRARIEAVERDESLLQLWESSSATVAVVKLKEALKIKVNNYYTLGGSGSKALEEVEGYLPAWLHPNPQSVFFLGLGTGISAGALLDFPLRRLVIAELIPEVVEASALYFGRYNHGLFFDPRVRVIAEDGRNVLAASPERYDLIIADLLIPWRSGAGSLYALEHYLNVRDRLQPDGLFMQWLPAYQLSKTEIGTIVRTMLAVFPQVTVWRGDFSAQKPVIGLLGQSKINALESEAALFSESGREALRGQIPLLAHYVGNLSGSAAQWQSYPINSDDHPVLEYLSPITQLLEKTKQLEWMTGENLLGLMERIRADGKVLNDPYLAKLAPRSRALSDAGMALHRSQVLRVQGRLRAAEEYFGRYKALVENNLQVENSLQATP